MTASRTDRQYRSLARCYDALFLPYRAPADAARNRILDKILPHVQTACDLGCGTGTTALALARSGIRMYAVDLSPDMCRLTRAKAGGAGLPVRVIQADMREFRLSEPVDLVTCEGDALNHVPRKSDLRFVARSVARALRPGGHFYFEVNNSAGFERYWTGTMWIEKPGFVVVMRNGHSRHANKAWSDIEIFMCDGKNWRRSHEHVDEVCWNRNEVCSILQTAGFDRLRDFDAAGFFGKGSMIGPGCRSFYLAHKQS